MNIGIFSDSWKEINGVTRMLDSLTKGLKKLGHKCEIFGPGSEKSSIAEFPFFPCPEYKVSVPRLKKIRATCEKKKTQLIHAHTPFTMGFAAISVKNKLSLPSVGTFHTLFPEYLHYISPVELIGLRKVIWMYLREIYSQFDVVTCPSRSVQKKLKKHGIKAAVVPNGINTHTFNSKATSKPFIKKYKLKSKYFISVGRVAREKKLNWILKAAQNLKSTNFVIGGKGPELGHLKKINRSNNVKFTGYIPDKLLPSAYKGAEAFIICSDTETQGLVCLEAMACGTPVIAYDCEVNRETVGSGGLYFTDPYELDNIILKIQDPKKRAKLSKKAREIAMKNSVEAMVKKYVKIYSSLL